MKQTWSFCSEVLGLVLILFLINQSVSEENICTKHKVVTKSSVVDRYTTAVQNYRVQSFECSYYGMNCYRTRIENVWVTELQSYTELEIKQFCCPGYKQVNCISDIALCCNPVCDFPCLHGICSAPNYCDCIPGYTKRNGTENICEPVCSQPCLNGYCSDPEQCSCNVRYEADPEHSYSCRPVCSTPCINAKCTSPDTCTCHPGYRKVTEDPHKCHAYCSKQCQNSICTQPDECTCLIGYEKDNNDPSLCNPVCSTACTNGKCTRPEECTCFDGFSLQDNHTCEPVCSSCLNSFCSAPGVCTCFPNYKVDILDKSICLPICSTKCTNAKCTAPGTCECFSGYEETDEPAECKPYCSDGCDNGVCTEPENCTCLWGYKSSSNSSNCSLSTSESHDCTFENQIPGHEFNRSCFNISSMLGLENVNSCTFMQELLVKHLENPNSASVLNFRCGKVSYLTKLKGYISITLVCNVTKHDSITSNELESNSTYDTETTMSLTSNSVYDYSTTEGFDELSSDASLLTEEPVDGYFTTLESESKNMEELPDNHPTTEKMFEVIFEEGAENSNEAELSHLPLKLKINIQFLPYILDNKIIQEFSNASLVQDWCLCHKSKKWKLCAGMNVELFLCPCPTTNQKNQLTVFSSTYSTFKWWAVSAMAVFLTSMIVLHGLKKTKTI